MSEADKEKSEKDQNNQVNKIEEKAQSQQEIAGNERHPEPSELSSIDPDDTLNAVFTQVICLVYSSCHWYPFYGIAIAFAGEIQF